MKLQKGQNGITMVSLAITIVILIIVTGISVNFGLNSIKTTQDSKLTSELVIVQHAMLEQYTKYKTTKNVDYLVGNKMELQEVQNIAQQLQISLVTIPETYSNKDYYRLDKATLLEIGIKDTDDEYIINYISGEVINITKKVTSNGTALYIRANSF